MKFKIFNKTGNNMSSLNFSFLFLIFLFFLSGCDDATEPCGAFNYSAAALPAPQAGINNQVDFDFNPTTCSATACACELICYVQIIRVIDISTGNFLAPNAQQTNRIVRGRTAATSNGWALDRLSGRVWGYYGRNDDGSFSWTLTTGDNTTTATLLDRPRGWPDGILFDAVSVPVCIDAAAPCVNNLLGYYYWMFIVSAGGDVGGAMLDQIAVEFHTDAFNEAVIEWDADAPGLGKNTFPAFVEM